MRRGDAREITRFRGRRARGVTEEIELICTMTGFRLRFLIHYIGEGFFRSVELGPS